MDRSALELMLERDLARVAAPDELWSRVQWPRRQTMGHRPARSLAWAVAAAALILAVWGLRASRRPADFRSNDPAAIQAWVKANAGVDLGLPARPPRSIHLLGAHLVSGGVEVAYRAAGHDARLLVSKAAVVSGGSNATFSWTARGERFTLACATPGELQAACLLCHT